MFLLKFKHEGSDWLLHNGANSFEGGNSRIECDICLRHHTAKSISIGGFEIVEMSVDELSKAIGGVPYKIISFSGGLIPFSAVKIVG
jgi:hypothetical protein